MIKFTTDINFPGIDFLRTCPVMISVSFLADNDLCVCLVNVPVGFSKSNAHNLSEGTEELTVNEAEKTENQLLPVF
jgi:hypothetical protein